MKYVLVALAVIVGLILVAVVVGAFLPKQHHVTRAARFPQPPEAIWTAMTNYQEFPSWRSNVKSVEAIPSTNNLPAWREFDSHGGSLPMQTIEVDPPNRLVTEIVDKKLPFGGTWTTEITRVEGGSFVRITEDGEVRNPIFRFMSRFVLGLTSTMETYLRDLGKKFGETVQVEN
jgi:uncharacterized protein YndB with AHSA1/START domain